MLISREELLKQLQNAITDDEWEEIDHNTELPISDFNRSVLLEMKTAAITKESDAVPQEELEDLHKLLKSFLAEYLSDKPEGWKWIIIPCIYLTYIAKRPMHPIDRVGIKEVTADGQHIYECPQKSSSQDTVCHYCVCKHIAD